MSTAAEMRARMAAAQGHLDRVAELVAAEVVHPTSVRSLGREVCARRARKLRKAGHSVQFHRSTSTGKARYKWLPKPLTIGLSQ